MVAVSVQDDGGRLYNDGQWHSIRTMRRGAVGTIVVNDQYGGNSSHIHTDHYVCLLCVWVPECGSEYIMLMYSYKGEHLGLDVHSLRLTGMCMAFYLQYINPLVLHGGIN